MAGLLDKYGITPSGSVAAPAAAPAQDTSTPAAPAPAEAQDTGAGLLQKYSVTPVDSRRSQYSPYTSTPSVVKLEVAKGAGRAVEKTGFGLAQLTLDGLAKVGAVTPEFRDRLTSWMADTIKSQEEGDVRAPMARSVGDVVGQVGEYALGGKGLEKIPGLIKATGGVIGRMLTSAGIGAGTEAAKFIAPDDEEQSRSTLAAEGAVGGGLFSVATEPLRVLGTKLFNRTFVRAYMDIFNKVAAGYDQNAATTAHSFQMGFGRIDLRRQAFNTTRDTVGDTLFPNVDASAAVAELNALKDQTVNKAAKTVIQNAMEALGTIKGQAGQVAGLSPAAQAQIAGKVGAQLPPVNYSRISRIADELEVQSRTARKSGEANEAIDEAKGIVNKLLTGLERQSPQLRRASQAADKYTREAYNPVNRDEFAPLKKPQMTPSEFHDVNKKAIDIASGDNAKLAEDLYTVLTPTGKESVKQGLVYRALDTALDPKTKTIDPNKVAEFFRKSSGAKVFFSKPEEQQALKGLENLTHASQKWSVSAHAPGATLMLWGGYHALATSGREGATEAAIGAASLLFFHNVGKLFTSQNGVNFLRAVGKLGPESPALTRAFNSMMTGTVGGIGGGYSASEQAFGAFGQ